MNRDKLKREIKNQISRLIKNELLSLESSKEKLYTITTISNKQVIKPIDELFDRNKNSLFDLFNSNKIHIILDNNSTQTILQNFSTIDFKVNNKNAIDENTAQFVIIRNSNINGKNSIWGNNVLVKNSYINNSHIGNTVFISNCTCHESLLTDFIISENGGIFLSSLSKFVINKAYIINQHCMVSGGVILEKGTAIGPNTTIALTSTHGHRPVYYNTTHFDNDIKDILLDLNKILFVENDVFIGSGVKINTGLKIGEWSILGSGSIISKDIPPFSVSYGINNFKKIQYDYLIKNPEKFIKLILISPSSIDHLTSNEFINILKVTLIEKYKEEGYTAIKLLLLYWYFISPGKTAGELEIFAPTEIKFINENSIIELSFNKHENFIKKYDDNFAELHSVFYKEFLKNLDIYNFSNNKIIINMNKRNQFLLKDIIEYFSDKNKKKSIIEQCVIQNNWESI